MTTRLLNFQDYIGGPDTIVVEMFPRMQKKYTYNFNTNVTGWVFTADYQTLVLSEVTYDRITGDPSFTATTILGSFPSANVSNSYISVTNATSGTVEFTIPENRYTGNIIPDARTKVVGTVVTFQWNQGTALTSQKDAHRFLVLERYEPQVPVGDPTQSVGFTPLVVATV